MYWWFNKVLIYLDLIIEYNLIEIKGGRPRSLLRGILLQDLLY